MTGQQVEHTRGHLRIAKHGGPNCEAGSPCLRHNLSVERGLLRSVVANRRWLAAVLTGDPFCPASKVIRLRAPIRGVD